MTWLVALAATLALLALLLARLAAQQQPMRRAGSSQSLSEASPDRIPVVVSRPQGADALPDPESAEDARERRLRLRALAKRARDELPALQGVARVDTALELWVASACLWLDTRGQGASHPSARGGGTLYILDEHVYLVAHGKGYRVPPSWFPGVEPVYRLTGFLEQADWRPGETPDSSTPSTDAWVERILDLAERALGETMETVADAED